MSNPAITLRERLEVDLKDAMKARDAPRLDTIRMLRARMLEREVELRGSRGRDYRLSDEEAIAVISTYAKQRRESIETFRRGGRDELAAGEEQELAIVEGYLPQQLSDDELRRLVDEVVRETGASSVREMGQVMKGVMGRVRGVADGARVSAIVRERLGAR
jgi:uncharacterized protein YqeY